MAIYSGSQESEKMYDSQGREILDIYDPTDKVVWSKMSSVSGTLPLTFNARSASPLKDYSIYGTSEGSGIATETGEPAGYKITLTNTSGATENLFSFAKSDIQLMGTPIGTRYGVSLSLSAGTYTIKSYSIPEVSSLVYGCIKYADESLSTNFYVVSTQTFTKTMELSEGDTLILYNPLAAGTQDSTYTAISESDILVISGSTAPDHYIPHRYTSNYDLFIGDSKLVNGEYLDYVEQKIYKRNPNNYTYPDNINGNYINPTRPTVNFLQCVWRFNPDMLPYLDSGGILVKIGLVSDFTYDTASARSSFTRQQMQTLWENEGENTGKFQVNSDTYPEVSFRTFVEIGGTYYYGSVIQMTKSQIDTYPDKTVEYAVPPIVLPVDPPASFPAITTYECDNILSSTETLGSITIEGRIQEISNN